MPPGFNVQDKPVIAQAVDLKDTDPDRQKLYGKLAEMEGGVEDLPAPAGEQTQSDPAVKAAADSVKAVTEDDKKEFLRSIMNGTRYVKTYMLFGTVKAVFADRTTDITEAVFQKVRDADITAEDKDVLLDRLLLVSQLTQLRNEDYIEGEIDEKIKKIIKLPKPLYQALMAACRDFENHVQYLTDHAQDADFWTPGGAGFSSTPAGPGR